MKRLTKVLSFALTIAVLATSFAMPMSSALVPAAGAQSDDNTLWSGGYWNTANGYMANMLPWDGNPGYGIAYMYDTLFGYNTVKGEYIPCIGETIEWSTDGLSIDIVLNDEAYWSGPGSFGVGAIVDNGTQITTEDVIFSYYNLTGSRWGDFFTPIDEITSTSDTEMTITLNAGYAFSKQVDGWLTSNVPILPKLVMEDILTTYDIDSLADNNAWDHDEGWQNRWDNSTGTVPTDADTKPEWKVVSGPYYPYAYTDKTEVFVRNPNYWGNTILYRDILGASAIGGAKPNDQYPEYIGHRSYDSNNAAILSLTTGEMDYGAFGVVNYEDIMPFHDNLHSFYHDDDIRTYKAGGSNIELVMNWNKYPFSELWMRQAISKCIDVEGIGIAASRANWGIGSPTYLNIQNPDHVLYYNETIHNTYKFVHDDEAAAEIMEDNDCELIDGVWQHTVPDGKTAGLTDVNTAKSGVQINLGGYTVITPSGWTDTTWAVEGWVEELTDFGIATTISEVDYGTVYQSALGANTYTMAMFCGGPATVASAFDMWNPLGNSHAGRWDVNPANWTGASATAFRAALVDFAASVPGSAAEKAAASELQEIYGANLPTLPLHINCLWYQYSDAKFKGWQNDAYVYQQSLTEWVVDKNVIKQRFVLALLPADYDAWNATDVWKNVKLSNTLMANMTGDVINASWTVEGEETEEPAESKVPFVGLSFMMIAGLGAAIAIMARKRK